MKILTIANSPLVETQGAGYVVCNFARGLRSRGHEVVCRGPEQNIILPRLKKAKIWRQALGMYFLNATLIRRYQPDLIEFYGGEAWFAASLLARDRQRPYVLVQHSNGIEPRVLDVYRQQGLHRSLDGRPTKWYQRILRPPVRRAFTKVDAIVTVSEVEARYARNMGYQPADRILALENALPDSFLGQPCRPEREKIIGYCGSWLYNKGTAVMTGALPAVLRHHRDWTFQIIGAGAAFDAARWFPADVLPQISTISRIESKRELQAAYARWSVALLPSIYESFGLAPAEAMASGAALVAAEVGLAADLQNGVEAMIVPVNAPGALAEMIVTLIKNDALRAAVAMAGHARVQSLRWDDNITKLNEFYGRLVTGKK